MLLAEVLAVPVNVQHLLVELLTLLLLFFRLRIFLETVLQLAYFKPNLFKLHDQSEEILNPKLLLVGEITVQDLLKETLIDVLGLYLVSDVQLMQDLFCLKTYLLMNL